MTAQPITDEVRAQRRAFAARWNIEILKAPVFADLPARAVSAAEEMDLRTCPNDSYAEVRAALEAKLERIAAANASLKDLRLSDALLKRLDRLSFADPPHPAGRDQPEPQPPAEFDDAPLPEAVP